MSMQTQGIITEIERYAINDGPGIRTNIFLKGCPLRCKWCANPETQKTTNQLMYWQNRCIGCQHCIQNCPTHSLAWGKTGITINREQCEACGTCTNVCNSQALTMAGEKKSVADILEIVKKDLPFYQISGGGVTFSGGEATSQGAFLLGLAKAMNENNIHTCIETCGYAKWETLESIVPYIDIFLFDIKTIDDDEHTALTGVSNALILENLCKLFKIGADVIVRIPIIPGLTDTDKNIHDTLTFLKKHAPGSSVSLLPYHRLGTSKYKKLNMDYSLEQIIPPSPGDMQRLKDIFVAHGFQVTVGE